MKVKFLIIIFLLLNNIFCSVREEKITNPIIAMGLSAVIPGSGQIYNGNWKKGLMFLGLELISYDQMNKYNNSAKSYINQYEEYADEHWEIGRWLENFYLFKNQPHLDKVLLGPGDDYWGPWRYTHGPIFIDDNIAYSHDDIEDDYLNYCGGIIENGGSCDLYLIPDQNAFVQNNNANSPCTPDNVENCFPYYQMPWGTLNFEIENGVYIPHPDYSSIYLMKDHHLYEGLGKYNEFFAGWDCVQDPCDEEATLEEARQVFKNNTWIITSDRKDFYQSLRNKSNKEFDKEELFLSLIFINHAVSMFDAFLTSINRTKKVNIESNMKYGYNNGIEINLKW